MKRSEAVNKVADLLEAYSGPAKLRAERLLNELSPNLAFDPEEEPLPEELELEEYSVGTLLLWPKGRRAVTHDAKRRYYREAVRRWNAWPELRKVVEAWTPGTIISIAPIKAILDGKEGE